MAWSYSQKEFIKVYRKFMQWEWYTDINVKTLFIHCLLRANWRPGSWHGINYDTGEFITSLPSLSKETGLTVRQVRTSLNRLISTGELTSRTTDNVTGKKLTKNRIITINNWNLYQGSDRQNDNQVTGNLTGKRQASDRQVTADIRSKEYKNYKKEKEKEPAALSSSPSQQDEEEGIDLFNMSDEEYEEMKRKIENGDIRI